MDDADYLYNYLSHTYGVDIPPPPCKHEKTQTAKQPSGTHTFLSFSLYQQPN
jgi:hypothetical protein